MCRHSLGEIDGIIEMDSSRWIFLCPCCRAASCVSQLSSLTARVSQTRSTRKEPLTTPKPRHAPHIRQRIIQSVLCDSLPTNNRIPPPGFCPAYGVAASLLSCAVIIVARSSQLAAVKFSGHVLSLSSVAAFSPTWRRSTSPPGAFDNCVWR
jgi:hypothetical protein